MTLPPSIPPSTPAPGPSLMRSAVWVAIGALIAAALVCVVWVLVGPQNDVIGKAFVTILLLAGFAGAAIYDAHAAPRRPSWYVLASMAGWVLILLAGALKIWMPDHVGFGFLFDGAFTRFWEFVGIVLVVRLALLDILLYLRAHQRNVTPFTRVLAIVTVVLVVVLALMLVVPLTFPDAFVYTELYWRFVVAVTILAAVGTALIPLINALNSPRLAAPARPVGMIPGPVPAPAANQWPTYVDGSTPLPFLPDGSPDWNAYYTGYPSPGAQVFVPIRQAAAPAQQPTVNPYEGYPPPPPLPPRPPQP